MEPEGLLSGMFLHPMLRDAFKKFPAADWVEAVRSGTWLHGLEEV